jgi:putative transcriptional regulator
MIATIGPKNALVLTNRLSRLIGERRVSIREVARETGIAYRALFELYHDRSTRLDLHTLNRLCNYFQVGPEQIFEWQPDPTPQQPEAN